jgi:uncharacterized small protein (DUF1192 family)
MDNMDPDDLPRKPLGMVIGENLDAVSLAELEQRIIALDSEIARIRVEIEKKKRAQGAADAFFTKKG